MRDVGTRVDVLLVDDDADDRALTLRSIRTLPPAPRVAEIEDGEAAIEYFRQALPPRLVLLDVKLPFRSGIEVLEAVRADPRLAAMPVVMLTSSEHDRDLRAAYAAGANGYVVKPGVYAEYVPCIQRTVEYWLRVNRSPEPVDLEDCRNPLQTGFR